MMTEPPPTDSGRSDEPVGSATPSAFDFLTFVLQGVAPELKPVTLLAYDIDAFERDAALFSAQLSIPVDELLEIAADARAGSDPTADKRPGQHVVSRSLLAAWCTGTSRRAGDQLIWPYSLDNGPETPIDPTDVGKVTHFVQVDSVRTVQGWETVENTLRDEVRRLAASPNLSDPKLVEKVKKIVALVFHVAQVFVDSTFSVCIPALIEGAERNDRLRRFHHVYSAERRQGLIDVIAEGVASGDFPADLDCELAALALLGPIIYRRLMSDEPFDPDRANDLVDIVLGPPKR